MNKEHGRRYNRMARVETPLNGICLLNLEADTGPNPCPVDITCRKAPSGIRLRSDFDGLPNLVYAVNRVPRICLETGLCQLKDVNNFRQITGI